MIAAGPGPAPPAPDVPVPPAPARADFGALVRALLPGHLATAAVPPAHRRLLGQLARCGTGELGHVVYGCGACGGEHHVPRGCGNRHCPQCQGRLARAWLERQQAALLPVPYFHVVFTLPQALRPLAAAYPADIYKLLFDAAAQTLLRVARERLGGVPGITAVLHTWGQQLGLHPHLHCIVTGGALAADGTRSTSSQQVWRAGRTPDYLYPVKVLGAIFRGKFLAGLTALRRRDQIGAPRHGWPALWRVLAPRKRWVVFAQRPFGGPEQVLAYLSNYTHRVAISARRILGWDEAARTVTFRYRDYADHSRVKACTLDADEFLRRFRQHFLPRGFTKIRHYGILANHARSRLVAQARAALAATPPPATTTTTTTEPAREPPRCPHCGGAHLHVRGLLRPDGRFIAVRPARTAIVAATPAAIRDPP